MESIRLQRQQPAEIHRSRWEGEATGRVRQSTGSRDTCGQRRADELWARIYWRQRHSERRGTQDWFLSEVARRLGGRGGQNRANSVPGTLKNDDKSAWTVKMTYTVSDDQFKALAADINKQLANPEDYNMQTNNCATWVVNEAGVAGVTLPQTSGTSEGGTGLDPGDLGQDQRDRGAQLNPSLQSGSGSSGSSGSSSGSSGSSSSSSGSSASPSPTPKPPQQQ